MKKLFIFLLIFFAITSFRRQTCPTDDKHAYRLMRQFAKEQKKKWIVCLWHRLSRREIRAKEGKIEKYLSFFLN